PRDRAKVPTGADEHLRGHALIHDPLRSGTTNGGDRLAVMPPGSRPAKQIVIELAPADAVADDAVVGSRHVAPVPDDAGSKAANRLKSAAVRVFVEIELEVGDGLRR